MSQPPISKENSGVEPTGYSSIPPLPAPEAVPSSSEAPPQPYARVEGTAATASRPTSIWRQTFSSLAVQDYRHLWLGMLFLMGAMQMQMLARGFLTFELTSSPAKLGIVSAGFAPPMFCLALFGGAIADRLNKKRIIQAGQVTAGLVALFVAVSVTNDSITWWHLLAASMVQGALFSFVMPARQALIPRLVGQQRVANAVSLDAMGMSATTLIAPAISGVLYVVIGPEGVYYTIGALCLASVGFTALLPNLRTEPGGGKPAIITDIKAGLVYIRRSPLVRVLLMMGLTMALLAMPFRFLMPVFVVDLYGRGSGSLGVMISVMGAGSLIGTVAVAALGRKKRGLVLIMGAFVTGIALLLVSLFAIYIVALVLMIFIGLGDANRKALNQALIMEVTEDQYRGRVMGVFMLNFALVPLGVLPAGFAAEYWGVDVAIGALAVLLLAVSMGFLITQRGLRDLS